MAASLPSKLRMTTHTLCCGDDQTAELYAMNRLNPLSAEMFEKHLLICSPCVDRVEEAQEYIIMFLSANPTIH